ncbi:MULTISPECIES: hypothetical protein [Cysteiniphilum]|uniref:Uncharacterized protein n=1 Tax=Cysteiniphilum litorale TaxID=2056700 RepID=A0A8J3E886_9GAMM|nr:MULTISPECIES: hypothetical protein [Cysteiniphilum]GGF96670.1 hypothetical protein GCM10010995_12400 [Cysteiniphilum litorale]
MKNNFKFMLLSIFFLFAHNSFASGWDITEVYITRVEVNSMDIDGHIKVYYSKDPHEKTGVAINSDNRIDDAWGKAILTAALTAFTTKTKVNFYRYSSGRFKSIQLLNY